MNVPKLSHAKLLRLVEQENNASVTAGNPRRFFKKKPAPDSSAQSGVTSRTKKAFASANSK